MSKILIIRGFYKEGERDYINVRKQFPQLFNSKIVNTIQANNSLCDDMLFVKEENKGIVLNAINKAQIECDYIEDITDYLQYWREDYSTINIEGIDIEWEECKNNLFNKIKNNEINLDKIFEMESNQIENYLYNIMDYSVIDTLQNKVQSLQYTINALQRQLDNVDSCERVLDWQ